MDNLTILTLVASLACPLVPQIISIVLLRRILRSEQSHYIAMAASGMVQVMSGLWLMRACYKLPLFFDNPLSAAYHEWARVSLDAGPNMAIALTLLVGWFWLVLAWSQRKAPRKVARAQLKPRQCRTSLVSNPSPAIRQAFLSTQKQNNVAINENADQAAFPEKGGQIKQSDPRS